MNSLIVVHFVHPQPQGYTFERKRIHWPYHTTLVPWFEVQDEVALRSNLAKASARLMPQHVTVGELEMFGPEYDIPVSQIKDRDYLAHVHAELYDAVRASGGRLENEDYVGAAYRPHITDHISAEVYPHPGSSLLFDDFHIVRLLQDTICRVEQRFVLSQGQKS